jgi:predicted nucleic acid-binding protein
MNRHVQIREIPEEAHRKLKARAAAEGLSMSDYLKRLIELEFLQTLRRYLRRGEIDRDRAADALRNFADMEIERCAHAPLRARVWDLRENLTAYDAAYIALAELLDAPLWTRDRQLSSVLGHSARVELL